MRHATHFLLAALVAALPLTLPRAAGAEEAVAEVTPAATPKAAFAAIIKDLPEPSEKHALDIDAEAVFNGNVIGTIKMTAQPVKEGEATMWRVTEDVAIGGGAMTHHAEIIADRHLQPVRGELKDSNNGKTTHLRWKRVGNSFEIVDLTGDADPASAAVRAVTHEGHALMTMACYFLFGRMLHPRRGSFATTVLDLDNSDGETVLEPTTFSVTEPGMWNGVRAYVVSGVKGEEDGLDVAYDVTTGAFLGARATQGEGPTMVVRLVEADETKEPEAPISLYKRDATTPIEAALQAGFALATADLDVLDLVMDWPAAHRAHLASLGAEDPKPTEEEYTASVKAKMAARPQSAPRAMIEGIMPSMKAQLTVEEVSATEHIVSFPPMFRSLKVHVGKIGSAWRLIRLPKSP